MKNKAVEGQSSSAPVDVPEGLIDSGRPAWVSDMVVGALRGLGVEYVFLTPGSSFRGLHDSLVNHGGNRSPQIILCLHEQVAVAAAHAYAKATGRVGVAVLHDLVGLMNAQMSVYNAWCDRAPLLLLGGGGPSNSQDRRWIDWLHSANAQAELVRPFTKYDDEPTEARGLHDALHRAWDLASSQPQGPTYVTLDVTLQEKALDDEEIASPRRAAAGSPAASPSDVLAAARWLYEADLPVLVAGRIGLDPTATSHLLRLAEALGAACLDDPNHVTIPTRHSLNLTGDMAVMAESDAVLMLEPADVRFLVELAGGLPSGRLIIAGLDGLWPRRWSNIDQHQPEPDLRLLSSGLAALESVTEQVEKLISADPEGHERRRLRRKHTIERRRAQLLEAREVRRSAEWSSAPIRPSRLVAELHAAVGHLDWLLAMRNGRSWPEGAWNFDGGGQYLGESGGGGIGYGPGGMVGAAFGAREQGRIAVAIIGDGDFLMGPAALWTLTHCRVPLLAVVYDSRSYHNDVLHQREVARHRGRPVENAGIGTQIVNPEVDVASLARSFGAWAVGPVAEPDDLSQHLHAAVSQVEDGGVAVVHAVVAP